MNDDYGDEFGYEDDEIGGELDDGLRGRGRWISRSGRRLSGGDASPGEQARRSRI